MTGCKIGKVKPKLRVVENFPQLNHPIIEALQNALDRAKQGDIDSGVWVFVTREGGRFTGNSHRGGNDYLALVGGIEEAKHHLMDVAKSVPQ